MMMVMQSRFEFYEMNLLRLSKLLFLAGAKRPLFLSSRVCVCVCVCVFDSWSECQILQGLARKVLFSTASMMIGRPSPWMMCFVFVLLFRFPLEELFFWNVLLQVRFVRYTSTLSCSN